MIILPATYLPQIAHFKAIIAGDYVIDIAEHYIKRSERNRAHIMTANGVMALTVNIKRANRPRTPMREVEIDYSKRWQHQHWEAIRSAYKSSPYFDYYADMLEEFYTREYKFLVEYNLAFTQLILKLLQQPAELKIADSYVTATSDDVDLRAKGSALPGAVFEPYVQVFDDRNPFVENLSILDLVLCEGTNAISYLIG